MGKFVITKRTNGEFQFNLITANNGQTILSSEGYLIKLSCENDIESVRKNSRDDSKYNRKTSPDGNSYFNLQTAGGQVIVTSKMYESAGARDNGIGIVKIKAPNAIVEDTTI